MGAHPLIAVDLDEALITSPPPGFKEAYKQFCELGFTSLSAPAEFGATAQGYLAVALGLVMAAAMGISGVLYARSESLAYGAMAVYEDQPELARSVINRAIETLAGIRPEDLIGTSAIDSLASCIVTSFMRRYAV